MSIKGHSYARFKRSLEVGKLSVVLGAAAELPRLNLDDALKVLFLIAQQDRAMYPRAADRWARLFVEDRTPTLGQLRIATHALEALPDDASMLHVLEALAADRPVSGRR